MRRSPLRRSPFVLAALLCGLLPPHAAARSAPTLEQRVGTHLQRAERLTKARKWAPALEEIARARDLVQEENSLPRGKTAAAVGSPAYRKDLESLRRHFRERARAARSDSQREALVREFEERKRALDRQHGLAGKPGRRFEDDRARRARARYRLLFASVDAAHGRCLTAMGKRDEALFYAQRGFRARVEAYQDLGKPEQAEAVARKLLALTPNDPRAYAVTGALHQRRGDFAGAAELWQQAIRLIESGKARSAVAAGGRVNPADLRDRQLTEYYRQLGFCYDRLGRPAETRAALQKARAIEAARDRR